MAVHRFVRHRSRRRPRDRQEIGERRRLAVGYRNAVPDAGRELPLPFEYGLKHIFYARSPHSLSCTRVRSIPIHQELHQFAQHALLTVGP